MATHPIVLHISDIHRTPHDRARNSEIILSLSQDVARWSDVNRKVPNFLVVSGDLTQQALEPEYNEAEDLIRAISEQLHLSCTTDVLIVPGNHDVHWDTMLASATPALGAPTAGATEVAWKGTECWFHYASERDYMRRLDNFAQFYERLTSEPYPPTRVDAWTKRVFVPNNEYCFVGFSSCDVNDKFRRHGQIHPDAILAAKQASGHHRIRIAVWHHDLDWRQEGDDHLRWESYRYIRQAGFSMGLCGHTHRSTVHNQSSFGGDELYVVAAGSLCVDKRERGESVPRLYNIVEFNNPNEEVAVVHVRAKPEPSDEWEEHARWGPEGAKRGYFTVPLQRSWMDQTRPAAQPVAVETVQPATAESDSPRYKTPSPFADWNARHQLAENVLSGYVWTQESERLESHLPQFVLGTRGSGKTSLLLTLSPQSWDVREPARSTQFLGIYAPIQIDVISSFTEKGWMPKHERKSLFRAILGVIWLNGLHRSLARFGGTALLSESVIYSTSFGVGDQKPLEDAARDLRISILRTLSEFDEAERARHMRALRAFPVFVDPINTIRETVRALKAKIEILRKYHFVALFDEAEHLNSWQQECLYELVHVCDESLTMKIATLPYAHTTALGSPDSFVGASGNDFSEIVLALAPDFDTDTSDTSVKFRQIAEGIWMSRVSEVSTHYSLTDVWPIEDYYDVVSKFPNMPETEDAFIEILLERLPIEPRERAIRQLAAGESSEFRSQYLRKYGSTLRFRLAHEQDPGGDRIPRYWGHPTMLRACDGNCRWFLQLLDTCWRRYWASSGIRPLDASEQNAALIEWAKARETPKIPGSDTLLREIVDRAIRRTKDRTQRGPLGADRFSVSLSELGGGQQHAVAVGIAYGLLVPEFDHRQSQHFYYPRENVRLRLGYPLAVANLLPLRTGGDLRIPQISQVVMPWWKD
jgi:hypothetical protein